MNYPWIEIAKRIQALAQSGLTYGDNCYDIERYEALRAISIEMMAYFSDTEMEKVRDLFANETGYQTPKVDIRGVIFQGDKILMVREKIDGCWSLPGGWADVGLSPAEVVVKEVWEEAGYEVKPLRLLAVIDKKHHPHPPSPYHIYKIFIQCEITGGGANAGMETSDVGFFGKDELPELSKDRNTLSQIYAMFEFLEDQNKPVLFD
ncbi:ADP-ribose pyrophosphatase YjhB, NUDIX family [Geosporobacter subterraneus DSM 17957]|uniref:ADP-ribose pyrophosphatase YjhB, NUDIX family n=1 Tax=Geosporobacter subterraneus DSM 17957 TaxID=1121919 RepID=A0A1M6MGL1_9FIRM|nr:NUDIX hydrolase [Geosporobacter subterraneus]SHJ82587.1 ADP-ribose pyrophosphatase YjhB, NUDIX family [Geosporobacter subterraneus DSM 17957]